MARRRIFIHLSIDSLLAKIAYAEANGYDFEAKTLKSLFTMTNKEKDLYKTFLDSAEASKGRRDKGYSGS